MQCNTHDVQCSCRPCRHRRSEKPAPLAGEGAADCDCCCCWPCDVSSLAERDQRTSAASKAWMFAELAGGAGGAETGAAAGRACALALA